MKRFYFLTLMLAFLPLVSMSAYDFEVDGIYYNLLSDNKVEVTKGDNKYAGDVAIPEEVNSYKVVQIGEKAFYNCEGLTSVTIPNSVTSIGVSSFDGCTSLTSVTIPNSVTLIGAGAFYGCSMTSIDIPNSVIEIGNAAFASSGLTSITIPNSVTTMGDVVFISCYELTSVIIGDNITKIGWATFEKCSSLTSVTLGNSVTSIGDYAFEGCSNLTFIDIPNSVTTIGSSAFWGCSGLTSLTIPNSITTISEGAFSYCDGLASVTIPNSVTLIGAGSFYDCYHLEDIYCYAEEVPSTTGEAFYHPYATLHVPATSIDVYKATAPWNSFGKIEALPQKIIYIIDGETYKTVTYPIGEAIIPEEEPKKAGYTFSGWSEIPETMPTKDVTVTGTFTFNNVEYVDLGLPSGLRWATCNVGADSPEQFGVYYDWDKNPVQESWDNMWRTPTKAERDELVKYCTYSVETINGIKGAQYTGVNGQKVFFPFAGYYQEGEGPYEIGTRGQYWTVTPFDSRGHWVLGTDYSTQADNESYYWPLEYFSFPVRPVTSGTFTDPVFISSYPMNKETTKHVYSIDGRPLNELQKGVNIIRYSNGQTKKVFVK